MKELEKELEDVAAHDNKKTKLKLVNNFLFLSYKNVFLVEFSRNNLLLST